LGKKEPMASKAVGSVAITSRTVYRPMVIVMPLGVWGKLRIGLWVLWSQFLLDEEA
jgi:hypothetical protein